MLSHKNLKTTNNEHNRIKKSMAIKMKIPYQVVDEMVAKIIEFITNNFYLEDVIEELIKTSET